MKGAEEAMRVIHLGEGAVKYLREQEAWIKNLPKPERSLTIRMKIEEKHEGEYFFFLKYPFLWRQSDDELKFGYELIREDHVYEIDKETIITIGRHLLVREKDKSEHFKKRGKTFNVLQGFKREVDLAIISVHGEEAVKKRKQNKEFRKVIANYLGE